MKKKLFKIFVFALLMLCPVYAKALSISASSTTITNGNSVRVTVNASGLTGKFSVTSSNGNVLTDKVYYSDLNEEYVSFTNDPIETDYIDRLKTYASKILEVSNGIITHDLIKREEGKIGECTSE